jgi:choline dehydrogenase-like flavoprotein
VVNADQRSWDHENLYLVGGGSMPTVSTSNVTLTIAALCLRSVRAMLSQLDSENAPIEISANAATGGRLQEATR